MPRAGRLNEAMQRRYLTMVPWFGKRTSCSLSSCLRTADNLCSAERWKDTCASVSQALVVSSGIVSRPRFRVTSRIFQIPELQPSSCGKALGSGRLMRRR